MTMHLPKADADTGTARPRGLGIDVGGTSTRWALVDPAQVVLAEGSVGGFTALMMGSAAGREEIDAVLTALAQAVRAADCGRPAAVFAGVTGCADDAGLRLALAERVAASFGLAPAAVEVVGDVELAYLDVFRPGEGILVYAGTGSVGAFIDAGGEMHRAGGRGALLDDGGSGYWIAHEAMRWIWRREDAQPGAWRDSALARAVFDRVGGADWAQSRDFVYQASRGRFGELALAVAASAEGDAQARAILCAAGLELARLAKLLLARFGPRSVALTGRAAGLHPLVESSFRQALPAGVNVVRPPTQPHVTAAGFAVKNQSKVHLAQ